MSLKITDINIGDVIEDQEDGNYNGEHEVASVGPGNWFTYWATVKGERVEITSEFSDTFVMIKKATN